MCQMASSASGGIRSLVCDGSGIVIAETVYRCMVCSQISITLDDIQMHYQSQHIEGEIFVPNNNQNSHHPTQGEDVDFENDNFDTGSPKSRTFDNSTYSQENNWKISLNLVEEENSPDENTGNFSQNVKANGNPKLFNLNSGNKGGFVICEVCQMVKWYSHVSRRYGIFSCESCAKFFYRYSQKPVKYTCSGTNKCPLNIDLPGARCKSCLLDACFAKFILDPKKHPKMFSQEMGTCLVPTTILTNSTTLVDSDMLPTNLTKGDVPLNGVDSLLWKPKKKQTASKVSNSKVSKSLLSKRVPSVKRAPNPISPKEEIVSPNETKTVDLPKVVFTPSAKKRKQFFD